MVVGILLIHLYLPDCDSLKAKRRILLSIKSRLKNKFNISISELGHLDSWKESQIGISCISNNGRYVDKELSYIVERVKSYPNVEIIDYSTEKI
ncbi:MAG: DUF503 domain-containing protein [Candidatus Ratteibacteria bacterium]|nr:DUF503 domain-containing protein [Candidatus Ratteibacteria bacterium]